jgi:hypothetical protein
VGINALVGESILWQPRISYGYTVWRPTRRGKVGGAEKEFDKFLVKTHSDCTGWLAEIQKIIDSRHSVFSVADIRFGHENLMTGRSPSINRSLYMAVACGAVGVIGLDAVDVSCGLLVDILNISRAQTC